MSGMDWRSSERLRSRRPIADGEVHLLEELGRAIGQARGSAGLSSLCDAKPDQTRDRPVQGGRYRFCFRSSL